MLIWLGLTYSQWEGTEVDALQPKSPMCAGGGGGGMGVCENLVNMQPGGVVLFSGGMLNHQHREAPVIMLIHALWQLARKTVSRAVTASAADAPPTHSGVEDPAHIALSEVRREPACAIYGPGVVVRGSG